MYKFIEEHSLNAWPVLQSFCHDGWLLRFAKGYTKRSNSVSPIYSGIETDIIRKIHYCERAYVRCGLDTVFKVTPFVQPGNLDGILDREGYAVVDPSSVQILDLSDVLEPSHQEIQMEQHLSAEWLSTMGRMNGLTEEDQETTRYIAANSYFVKGFFTLYCRSVPVSCGIGVLDQGMVGLYDIVTDSSYRNQGFGMQLILHILKWAKQMGAKQSYILVVKQNRPAEALYEKIGYREIYTYWYRRKKCSELESLL
ncbi:GNAT family N-acetyltransferase [Marinicrinis lubricantis]|uniref:GNAT family N-acetyltransferase n=1 Tax=Marinicrinis lubricantis TaxID=2086470 RepID=A0ABW1IL53_9BACL